MNFRMKNLGVKREKRINVFVNSIYMTPLFKKKIKEAYRHKEKI